MTEEELKEKAEKLWIYFAENIFENKGNYSYNTNLVFSFADYIDNLSDTDIADYLQCSDIAIVIHFKKMLNHAIDVWLKDYSKTIALM